MGVVKLINTSVGDSIIITNPRKPYLIQGKIHKVVGHTKIMQYPYIMIGDKKRYVSYGEYKVL